MQKTVARGNTKTPGQSFERSKRNNREGVTTKQQKTLTKTGFLKSKLLKCTKSVPTLTVLSSLKRRIKVCTVCEVYKAEKGTAVKKDQVLLASKRKIQTDLFC